MSKEKFKYTKEFLEKVKNGDNDATTLLYEDAKDIAYNKAYSILNNHHDAEDIAEDSVLRAIEKIDTIKKPSEFPAWIRRVAENKAKDYIKKDKPTYMGEDFEYTTNDLNSNQKVLPEKMADSQENIDLYKKLISKLTDDQRNALVLNRIEGYKTREIAEMLGCSENTIKSRIHQGEKKLVKEAENLKKKGYTLNGMMPLDFFTIMSKSLGVTSTNVTSVVGATTTKSLSLKAMVSIVTAILLAFSGLLGTNLLYGVNTPQQLQSPHTTSTSSTMPTFSSQASSTNKIAPTTVVTSAPEKVTTMVPVTVAQNQHTIPTKVVPKTVPVTFPTENYQITSTVPSTQTNTKVTKPIYKKLTIDEIIYIKTILAYISDDNSFDISYFRKMKDDRILSILSKNYFINQTLKNTKNIFPLAQIVKVRGKLQEKIAQENVQKVAKMVFGKNLSNNASSSFFKLINDYYYFDLSIDGIEDSNIYNEFNINDIKYNKNRSQVTVEYTIYDRENEVQLSATATFIRNNNNKEFPFRIVSVGALSFTSSTQSRYYIPKKKS